MANDGQIKEKSALREHFLRRVRVKHGLLASARAGEATLRDLGLDSLELVRVISSFLAETGLKVRYGALAELSRDAKLDELLGVFDVD